MPPAAFDELLELDDDEDDEDDDVAGADVGTVGMVASTAIALSSNPDVDAAARSEHAAIAAARDLRGHGIVLGDQNTL